MPKYLIEFSDGRKFSVEADRQPSAEDVLARLGTSSLPESAAPPSFLERAGRWAKDNPATLGGAVGGLVMAPFTYGMSLPLAAGLTGLAGAGGAGYALAAKQVATGTPDPNVLQKMSEQALTQGATQAFGMAAKPALQFAGKRLYQGIAKPAAAIRRQFPGGEQVEAMLEHFVPISEAGAAKAGGVVRTSRDASTGLVNAQHAATPTAGMDATDIVANGLPPTVDRLQKGLLVSAPAVQGAQDYANNFLAEHYQQRLSLPQLQHLVRGEDRALNAAYRTAVDSGQLPLAGAKAAEFGLTGAARAGLRDQVPGLAKQNLQTQALEGGRQMVAHRAPLLNNLSVVGMQHGLSAALGGSVGAYSGNRNRGLGAFAAAEALTNPTIAPRLAMGLWHGAKAAHPLALSSATRAALLALLNDRSQP